MVNRFFHPQLPESGTVVLDGLEAHHLMHVLRASAGDQVEIFNGAGLVALAQILAIRKRDAELQILSSHHEAKPEREIIVGTAVPKGDRFDWLIEKSTELGVTRLIPLVTSRSVVDPRDSKLEKQRQAVIAACKQSRRNHLLEISPVMAWTDFVKAEIPGRSSYIAHPSGDRLNLAPVESSSIVFAVGPEGGFKDDEVAMAIAAGAKAVSLGPCILRIETAVLALAACASLG